MGQRMDDGAGGEGGGGLEGSSKARGVTDLCTCFSRLLIGRKS